MVHRDLRMVHRDLRTSCIENDENGDNNFSARTELKEKIIVRWSQLHHRY
jgi:hypothetical protein